MMEEVLERIAFKDRSVVSPQSRRQEPKMFVDWPVPPPGRCESVTVKRSQICAYSWVAARRRKHFHVRAFLSGQTKGGGAVSWFGGMGSRQVSLLSYINVAVDCITSRLDP
jgi:hypothetical protein